MSPCAPNMVQFRPLFSELRHFKENGTHHFVYIGRHLESASSTKLEGEGGGEREGGSVRNTV